MIYKYHTRPINVGDKLICVRTSVPDELLSDTLDYTDTLTRWFGLSKYVREPIQHGTVIEFSGVRKNMVSYKLSPRTQKEELYQHADYIDYHTNFLTFFTGLSAVLTDKELFLYELSGKLPRFIRKRCREYDEKTSSQFIEIMQTKIANSK